MIRHWYNNRSLKFKITFLSTLVATLGMTIVCAAFVFFEIGTFKKELQNEQLVRLNLIGNAISAAIVFEDQLAIDEGLTVFGSLPEVKSVLIFSADGTPTNQFIQGGSDVDVIRTLPLSTPKTLGYVYRDGHLFSQVPIYVEGDLVGVIVSKTELIDLQRKIFSIVIIALAALPVSVCLAYLLGRLFSERLVQPIEDLADTMERVKKTNNYEILAEAPHENEMGHLAENFNEMLLEIRLRDDRLETQTSELQAQKEKAEAGSRAKSEFLANMSHELRTPMNGILGMTEVLTRSGLNESQKKFADIIYRSGTALTTILNDILDFSKIEADKLDLDSAPFNIRTMVNDVINLLDNKAQSKEIGLDVNFNPYLKEMAIGDVGRIRQVLTNIVGNAIKFTHTGCVRIDIRGKSENGKYKLSVSVTDTGIGIPAQKLDLVFQKFTQAESSTTRDYGGTGLGLAISRSLVELMGGRIGVRSEENNGSTFWFDIMLDEHEVQSSEQREPSGPSGFEIVFLSHSEKVRDVFEKKFESLDVRFSGYKDGTSAISYAQTRRQVDGIASVIIVQDSPNGVDALSLLDRLKSLPEMSNPPVVVLRSDKNEMKTKRFARHTEARTMFAPFQMRSLIDEINEMLADRHGRALMTITKAAKLEVQKPQETEKPADVNVPCPAPTSAKPRILVADDNQVNRMVIENMIDSDAYDIATAVNGKEAVEAHQAAPFDVILMDISMPVMTGIEAMQAIRALETRNEVPAVPIVAVTAHAMASDREEYMRAGMDDYLSKPVNQASLIKMLERWTDSTENRDAA